jgi:hypothetical protein
MVPNPRTWPISWEMMWVSGLVAGEGEEVVGVQDQDAGEGEAGSAPDAAGPGAAQDPSGPIDGLDVHDDEDVVGGGTVQRSPNPPQCSG